MRRGGGLAWRRRVLLHGFLRQGVNLKFQELDERKGFMWSCCLTVKNLIPWFLFSSSFLQI